MSNTTIILPFQNFSREEDALYSRIIECTVTPKGPDIFGKVSNIGYLRLKTQVKSVWRLWKRGSNDLAGWVLLARKPTTPIPKATNVKAHLAPISGTIGRCSLDWRDVNEDMLDTYVVYCAQITRTEGLLVELADDGATYRRYGTLDLKAILMIKLYGRIARLEL